MGQNRKRPTGSSSGKSEPTPAWQPVTDKVTVKRLSKLMEEAGELISVCARCLAQGLDGVNPDNGKSNRRWLEEELSDVAANLDLVHEHFTLDTDFIQARMAEKRERQLQWQPE